MNGGGSEHWRRARVRAFLPQFSGSLVHAPGDGSPDEWTSADRFVPAAGQPRDVDEIIADCAVYEEGGRRSGRLPLAGAREAARQTDGFLWIGLQQPTADEVAVVEEFRLPALAVEDAVLAPRRARRSGWR